MMIKKLKLILLLLLPIRFTGVVAQEAILASGIDAVGSGGSVSYSVGQIVYTSERGDTGSLLQGVQLSYEISVVTGVENKKTNLEISTFPNPTTNHLILTIDNIDFSNCIFQLFDITGKFLQEKKIMNSRTTVDLSTYSTGVYFMKILSEKQELKNFKIIKN